MTNQIKSVFMILLVLIFLLPVINQLAFGLPEDENKLDCLACHDIVLLKHDKLGSGNDACYVCHDEVQMDKLQLFNGTLIDFENEAQICRQCHQNKYADWIEGLHGKYGPYFSKVEGRTACPQCHNPHAPPFPKISVLPPPQVESTQNNGIISPILGIFIIIGIALVFGAVTKKRG